MYDLVSGGEHQNFWVSPHDLLFKNRDQAALFFTLERENLDLLRQCFDCCHCTLINQNLA